MGKEKVQEQNKESTVLNTEADYTTIVDSVSYIAKYKNYLYDNLCIVTN